VDQVGAMTGRFCDAIYGKGLEVEWVTRRSEWVVGLHLDPRDWPLGREAHGWLGPLYWYRDERRQEC